jgi:hypothetical protein
MKTASRATASFLFGPNWGLNRHSATESSNYRLHYLRPDHPLTGTTLRLALMQVTATSQDEPGIKAWQCLCYSETRVDSPLHDSSYGQSA